jgi:hypothetical protein
LSSSRFGLQIDEVSDIIKKITPPKAPRSVAIRASVKFDLHADVESEDGLLPTYGDLQLLCIVNFDHKSS